MDSKAQIRELITEIEKTQNMWLDKNNVLKALKNILKKRENKYKK